MVKEFLTIHIGQAGVQTSHALWELFCIEHGVTADGFLGSEPGVNCFDGEHIEVLYSMIKSGRYVPRALLLDLEPTVVDEVRTGWYRQLWNPQNLLNGKEDAASNYARGYLTVGKIFLGTVLDRIQKETEKCDNLVAFELNRSFAGGTGSGFGSLISEKLGDMYGKKFKFSLGVYPSPNMSEIMTESYNTILHTDTDLNHEDCVILFDNESLFKKTLMNLHVRQPTFALMNRIISQIFTNISLSHRYRFIGTQRVDVTELLTNLIPYPRIHFPVISYTPLISSIQKSHEFFDVSQLTTEAFDPENQLIYTNIQKFSEDNKYMSCCMLYRGSRITPKPVIDALARVKANNNINFVDWCPTGFKIGINTCPPIEIPKCEQACSDNALCMLTNHTAIKHCWSSVARKYDMLLSRRAFVHWYVTEGMEEGEFIDARDNIETLILDYQELQRNTDDLSLSGNVIDTTNNSTFKDLSQDLQISDETANFEQRFGCNGSAKIRSTTASYSMDPAIKCSMNKMKDLFDKYERALNNNSKLNDSIQEKTQLKRNLTFSKRQSTKCSFEFSKTESYLRNSTTCNHINSSVITNNNNNSSEDTISSLPISNLFKMAKLKNSNEFIHSAHFKSTIDSSITKLPVKIKRSRTILMDSKGTNTSTEIVKSINNVIKLKHSAVPIFKQSSNIRKKILEKSTYESVICDPCIS